MKIFKSIIFFFLCIIPILCGGCDREDPPVSSVPPAPATASVTFPEGWNIMQYAERLEENGVCTAEEFYNAINDIDYTADYPFLPDAEILDNRIYKLEGYLYPDTYEFYLNTTGETVVRKILNNFNNKVYTKLSGFAEQNGLSFDDSINLASIVEKETFSTEDTPKIAAVFLNRLNNPAQFPRLQSDATWHYPYPNKESKPDGFESEYSTYVVTGLPKGAICNPSYTTISGTLQPTENFEDYYYFFTDKNLNFYYSKTYAEHLKQLKDCKAKGLYE